MFTTEEIIIYLLLGVNILLILWIARLEIKTRDIGVMKDKKSLKSKFDAFENKLIEFQQSEISVKKDIQIIKEKQQDNVQNIEIIRFNPFKQDGIGGDQSFAIAFLNKKGDGAVMSSLYTRDKVSVFAKPIENWQSKYELSEEEREVLERVKG